jgi:beta-lactamase class A
MSHTSTKTIHPGLKRRSKDVKHGLIARDTLKAVLRTTLGGALLAVGISLAIQLAYPRSMALPQTHIGGKNYSFQSESQIAADIAAMHERKMHIISGSQTMEYTPKELGITFTSREDAKQAVSYGWRERLVPFSFFFERREIPYYGFSINETKAGEYAASLKQYNKAPVDAAVHLEGAKVTITKQQDGYVYDAEQLVAAIKSFKLTSGMTVTLQPTVAQPNITDEAAIEAGSTLRQRLQKPIIVKAGGKSVTASPALLASWMVLTPDAQDKKLHIGYDKEKVKQWLSSFANEVYRPGTPRTVTMLDGVATGGGEAADGLALSVDATAESVVSAATANQPTVEGVTTPVIVPAQTIRNYTRSSQGLQALLNYWDESNPGTWGIVLKDFNGSISASFNPDRQFTSASVYKIYVAYVVYAKVDNGEFGMSSATNNGNDVSGCVDLMIVRSDNSCAHALGDLIGWDANDGMLHASGFGSTSIALGGALTTARDAANFLMQLQNGTLLSTGNRDAMLNMMGRNIYRYAIPAGSVGMHSANKLGALGAYNHDVAIVYHPKGTYVLSVFSYGSNHYRIRELARQIAAVMAQ